MSIIQFNYATSDMCFYKNTGLLAVVEQVMVDGGNIGELAKVHSIHRSSVHRCIAKITSNLEKKCQENKLTMVCLIVPDSRIETLYKQEKNLLSK